MEDDIELNTGDISRRISEFLSTSIAAEAPVALLTSGGTTVPLERNTVRFLDNFSTGKRGAACTENLLSRGYYVLLLRRRGSLAPFLRHIRPAALLADLEPSTDDGGACVLGGTSAVALAASARAWRTSRDRLLTLPFTTVDDYLSLLEQTAKAVAPLGHRASVILAAAVSDFHIPPEALPEHKLPSTSDPLTLTLQPVRKVVGVLASTWCPEAFTVTFKLETDSSVLEDRARRALKRYGHQLVVGNLLQTRRDAVTMVTETESVTVRRIGEEELEEKIIEEVVRRHKKFMGEDVAQG